VLEKPEEKEKKRKRDKKALTLFKPSCWIFLELEMTKFHLLSLGRDLSPAFWLSSNPRFCY